MPALSRLDERRSCKSLIRLLVLFLALAVAASPYALKNGITLMDGIKSMTRQGHGL